MRSTWSGHGDGVVGTAPPDGGTMSSSALESSCVSNSYIGFGITYEVLSNVTCDGKPNADRPVAIFAFFPK